MFKYVREYMRFVFVQGTGRNVPDPVFVRLAAFFVCGTLKSSQFAWIPSQDSNHPDDLFQSMRYLTPAFKPFSCKLIINLLLFTHNG